MASSSEWTWRNTKLFETLLVTYEKDPQRFQKIANIMGKTTEEVKIQYQNLVDDVKAIEAGEVPLPNYKDDAASGSGQDEKKK